MVRELFSYRKKMWRESPTLPKIYNLRNLLEIKRNHSSENTEEILLYKIFVKIKLWQGIIILVPPSRNCVLKDRHSRLKQTIVHISTFLWPSYVSTSFPFIAIPAIKSSSCQRSFGTQMNNRFVLPPSHAKCIYTCKSCRLAEKWIAG